MVVGGYRGDSISIRTRFATDSFVTKSVISFPRRAPSKERALNLLLTMAMRVGTANRVSIEAPNNLSVVVFKMFP